MIFAGVRATLAATGHPALLLVDGIASVRCEKIRFDDWGVDALVGASQKSLMMPAGMSFVWFSDKVLAASENAGLVTPYWDWKVLCFSPEFYKAFAGTAPAQHLYGLREALASIMKERIGQVIQASSHACPPGWVAVDALG